MIIVIQVDTLRSTCNLTSIVLTGQDIELLLLKKDVQDKLKIMGEVTLAALPDTITKASKLFELKVKYSFLNE